jgi:hypothetical protein
MNADKRTCSLGTDSQYVELAVEVFSMLADATRVLCRLENEHARELVADAIFQAEHALGGQPAHHRMDGDRQ